MCIGAFPAEDNFGLHVVAGPLQEPVKLEGLNIGMVKTDVIAIDANDALRYRPIADLTLPGEWPTYISDLNIYANRASLVGIDVDVTSSGRLGIDTAGPQNSLDRVNRSIIVERSDVIVNRSPSLNESIRLAGSASDVLFTTSTNGFDFNLKFNAEILDQYLNTNKTATKIAIDGDPRTQPISGFDGDAFDTTMIVGNAATDEPVVVEAAGLLKKIHTSTFDSFWDRLSGGGLDYVQLNTGTDLVGIGTAGVPSAKLHVVGDVRIEDFPTNGATEMAIVNAIGRRSTQAIPAASFARTGTTVSLQNIGDNITFDSPDFQIESGGLGVAQFDGANRRMSLGDVASPLAALHIRSVNTSTDPELLIESYSDAGISSNYRRMLIHAGTGVVYRGLTNENQNGFSASDARLKNINAPIENVLDALDDIQAIEFSYKSKAETGLELDSLKHYGVIAQEIQKHFPVAVQETDGYLHVKYDELIGVLLGAAKELKAENDELESRNDHLDELVHHMMMEKAELERKVTSLEAQTSELQTNMTTVMQYINSQKNVHAGGGK